MSIVSFDIGIKNLAYCQLEKIESKYSIISWENVNLLEQDTPTVSKIQCYSCKAKALYINNSITNSILSCKRHASKPLLVDLSGNCIMKYPLIKDLIAIIHINNPQCKYTKKEDLIKELSRFYAIPIQKDKTVKTKNIDLCYLHDCMRKLVLKHKEEWILAKEICLENQPAFKNPQMKSVQMLLFATIRDILQPSPPTIRLVNASKKLKGLDIKKGDEGYSDRKKGSENRVNKLLGNKNNYIDKNNLIVKYTESSKKNDLSDAFCMCIDALN